VLPLGIVLATSAVKEVVEDAVIKRRDKVGGWLLMLVPSFFFYFF